MNPQLEQLVRASWCKNCRLHTDTDVVCQTGAGPDISAEVVIVTKTPLAPTSKLRAEIVAYFAEVGLDAEQFMWCSAIKCNTWGMEASKGDQKACAPYLRDEFKAINPRWVITFGAEAWFAASGWADVTKHRGRLYDVTEGDGQIFPTIAPGAVGRSPGLRGGFLADLHYFTRLIRGEDGETPAHHTNAGHVTTVTDKDALRDALRAIRTAYVASYDVETTIGSEFDSDARIVSIAVTVAGESGMDSAHTYEIPLWHPDSPFLATWATVVWYIVRALVACPRRVAHNAKFDTKWLRRFGTYAGWRNSNELLVPTFDTIIAAHILDENRPKGLKPLAQMLLGAEPWAIDIHGSKVDWWLQYPLADILHYNGLDTWHTLRLYYVFRQQLKDDARKGALFVHLMMPLVQELVPVEQRGVWVDMERLMTNWNSVRAELEDMSEALLEWVPPENPFIKVRKRDGAVTDDGVNFGPSNFLKWWLYDHLGLPVLKYTATGQPSTAEDTMAELAELHPAAKILLDRVPLSKYDTSFFRPWSEQLDEDGRIHSVFKPWGTVTGRLSSGKEDAEKITSKAQQRGVNLQQVPRDKRLRGCFGAAPGFVFVEFDYSQVELRVAAMLANEPTMLHLYNTGQDIHMAMAMRMTGKPASEVTAEERKRAKAVNFGFLYGMGWRKFIATAWSNYGLRVTEDEAKAFRKSFFDEFPALVPWHAKQRRLARTFKRVETPMGRVRHLPDIDSPDEGVRAEAERQAINSPVQGFASDMACLSLIHTARRFRKMGLRAYPIGAVHDAVNFEIHREDAPVALPIIKEVMENLPLARMFGINLTVPIVADCKVGTHWGGATELSDVTMLQRPKELASWIEKVA